MSIIDKANILLTKRKVTYTKIAADTGLGLKWLINFNLNYKKGHDFHARKIETLIKYLEGK